MLSTSSRVNEHSTEDPLTVMVEIILEASAPAGLDLGKIEALAEFVCAREGARGAWELAILLTDDARIRALHKQFMGLDEPTDVMTFPRLPAEFQSLELEPSGGDIVISLESVDAQASEYGMIPANEVYFLTVHGVLHLLGWEDGSDEQRRRMLCRQDDLTAAFTAARGATDS